MQIFRKLAERYSRTTEHKELLKLALEITNHLEADERATDVVRRLNEMRDNQNILDLHKKRYETLVYEYMNTFKKRFGNKTISLKTEIPWQVVEGRGPVEDPIYLSYTLRYIKDGDNTTLLDKMIQLNKAAAVFPVDQMESIFWKPLYESLVFELQTKIDVLLYERTAEENRKYIATVREQEKKQLEIQLHPARERERIREATIKLEKALTTPINLDKTADVIIEQIKKRLIKPEALPVELKFNKQTATVYKLDNCHPETGRLYTWLCTSNDWHEVMCFNKRRPNLTKEEFDLERAHFCAYLRKKEGIEFENGLPFSYVRVGEGYVGGYFDEGHLKKVPVKWSTKPVPKLPKLNAEGVKVLRAQGVFIQNSGRYLNPIDYNRVSDRDDMLNQSEDDREEFDLMDL